MMETLILAVKILAIVSSAFIGALLVGGVFRFLVWAFAFRAPHRLALRLVRLLGGLIVGLLVYGLLWHGLGFLGGEGGGWGLFGRGGDGANGEGQANGRKPTNSEPTGVSRQPGEQRSDTLRVRMLGGDEAEKDGSFYVLEKDRPRNLDDLKTELLKRRDESPDLKIVEIIISARSVAADHPAVKALESWAREREFRIKVEKPEKSVDKPR